MASCLAAATARSGLLVEQSSRTSRSAKAERNAAGHLCKAVVAQSSAVLLETALIRSLLQVCHGLLICNCWPVPEADRSSTPASFKLRYDGHRFAGRGLYQSTQRTRTGIVRAEAVDKPSGGSGKFLTGFLIGGVVLGVLGFFFAPQISKTLLGENEDGSPRRLPRWLDEEDSLEATRRSLNEKIAQLNAAIDDVSAQLRADETADEELETSL